MSLLDIVLLPIYFTIYLAGTILALTAIYLGFLVHPLVGMFIGWVALVALVFAVD